MYSTCIYCNKSLGANEILEHFPVGRRLAFDAAQGRLWVVCRRCERWNLSPLDARWEAIEECERAFSGTRVRVSSDHIGMARLREGLELVRIGQPQRPEFAAWRYGDQFGRRRRRYIMVGAGVTVAIGAVAAGAMAAGVGFGSFGGFWGNIPNLINAMRSVKFKTEDGTLVKVRGTDFAQTKFVGSTAGDPRVVIGKGRKARVFHGPDALRAASKLLPAINSAGGSKRTIGSAVEVLERERGSDAFLHRYLGEHPDRRDDKAIPTVAKLAAPTRLALEMALHEESERRAIEGELYLLEVAWKEAEEIARISDNLLVTALVETQLDDLKKRSDADR